MLKNWNWTRISWNEHNPSQKTYETLIYFLPSTTSANGSINKNDLWTTWHILHCRLFVRGFTLDLLKNVVPTPGLGSILQQCHGPSEWNKEEEDNILRVVPNHLLFYSHVHRGKTSTVSISQGVYPTSKLQLIGILMFIYGVGFKAVTTYKIELAKDTDKSTVFLPPAILSAVTIAFSFSMILNCTNGYKKILLGIVRTLSFCCMFLWDRCKWFMLL